jgi:peptidoglycan/LPS O-acetylase OafA/YrhL
LLVLLSFSLIPPLLRFLLVIYNEHHDFGYYITATHFRFEGLILGVAASHVFTYFPNLSKVIGSAYFSNAITATIAFLSMITPFVSNEFVYYIGLSIIAFSFCLLVLSYSVKKSIEIARMPIIKSLATLSYSIYLTHSLVVHVVLLACKKMSINNFLAWLIMIVAIYITGYVFYNVVEKKILVLRDKLVPKLQSKS